MVHKDLIYEILSVVEEIPEGCVATYGQIARLIGRDKNSRLVGKVLSMADIMVTIRVTGSSIMRGVLYPDGWNSVFYWKRNRSS